MKTLIKWIDVSAAIHDEITNKRDLYLYINDHEEKRIVEIMEKEDVKE